MIIQIANPQSTVAAKNPLVLTTLAGDDIQMNEHLVVGEDGAVYPLPAEIQRAIRDQYSQPKVPGYVGLAIEAAHKGDAVDIYCMFKDQLTKNEVPDACNQN